jgi:8-oxo-dGTP pyrophosphatase MutT (NUDIX family)
MENSERLRTVVRAALEARTPIDERERRSIERFLAELDRLEDPFDEHDDPTHVTGSSIVIGPRGVLLLRHRRLGMWMQPGGHLDPGENPWDAARRETTEETGLDVRFAGTDGDDAGELGPPLAHIDVHPASKGHTHLDLRYLLDGGDADPAPPPHESQDVRWFSWPDAIAIADESLRGALEALRPR